MMKNNRELFEKFLLNLNLDQLVGKNISPAETALLERYANIVDAVIDNEACFIGLFDLTKSEKQYVFVSNGCRRVLGYEPEEILKNGFELAYRIIYPEDMEFVLKLMFRMNEDFITLPKEIALSKIFESENRIIQKSGKVIWMRSHQQLLTFTENGKPQLVFFINTDVTHEKELDLALIEKSKKEKELLEEKSKLELENSQSEKEIYKLELDKLRLEFQYKEKELANFALNLASKNECLNNLEKNFKVLKDKNKEEIKVEIDRILISLRSNFVIEKEWGNFQVKFNSINQNFINNLIFKFPDLTTTEINIVSMLRLQMQPKDIALFKYVTLSNIQNHIYRIRIKLGLTRKDSITKFLMEM
jgi:PAS domain S-box-containing protein